MVVLNNLKMFIEAMEAKSAPPIGPVLAQYYVNLLNFCKQFNSDSSNYLEGVVLRVKVFVNVEERSFVYYINTPTVKFYLENLLDKDSVNKLSLTRVYDILRLRNYYDFGSSSSVIYCKDVRSLFGYLVSYKFKFFLDCFEVEKYYLYK